tara:strand:- start:1693 stop:1908 length:216 start_codon:yes stop_codon:yes gene_type:complete
MARIIRHTYTSAGWHCNPSYMAHITVRQQVKGARRVTHEYHADDTADLWQHAIEFLHEGFSVISVEMYTCE